MLRRQFLTTSLAATGTLALSGAAQALDLSRKSPPNKWAILYGSQCGSTREYAGYINEGMGGIADVVDIAVTTPKVTDYDYFVIGGWRSGNSVQPAKIPSFITANKAALKEKIKGLFVVLGNNGNATLTASLTSFLTTQLVTPSGVSNAPAKVLFGRSDPKCNNLGFTYDNVKKTDGTAFGKQIIDTATAALFDASHHANRFALSHRVNPLTGEATISYTLPAPAQVQLSVNALNGRRVATLASARREAGCHGVTFSTAALAPGIYFYRLETGAVAESRILQVGGY